jgi:hypothetical protein
MVVGVTLGLLCPGCSSTVQDPATGARAEYQWETLTAELDQEIGVVYPAAKEATDELDLRVMREEVDGLAGEIRVIDAHLDSIDIQMEAMPAGRTLLTIRVGIFGDKNKSTVLFGEIMENLAQRAGFARR